MTAALVIGAALVATLALLAGASWFGRRLDRVEADLAGAPVPLRSRLGWLLSTAASGAAAAFGLAGACSWVAVTHFADLHDTALLAAMVVATGVAELAAVLVLVGGRPSRLALARPGLRWVAYGVVGAPLILGMSAGWEALLSALGEPPEPQDVIRVLGGLTPLTKAAGALSIGVVAPLLEEVLFRGAWFARLEPQIGPQRTIVLTGLCFGLLHMSSPWAVPILATMGLGLGWLRARSGSIWPGFLLHALNNTIAIVLVLSES